MRITLTLPHNQRYTLLAWEAVHLLQDAYDAYLARTNSDHTLEHFIEAHLAISGFVPD